MTAAVGFALAACAPDVALPKRVVADQPDKGAQSALEFKAAFDPATGKFEITTLHGQTGQGLAPANNVQDGTAGSGPTNSIEAVTTNTFFDSDGTGACGFAGTWCADVDLTHFYNGPLLNVFAQVTSISPAAGHTGVNSDDGSGFGLSNTFGLWSHGTFSPGTPSTRRWVFGDDGTGFQVNGRIMADLCFNLTQDGAETGVDCGGPECTACGGGTGLVFDQGGGTPSTGFTANTVGTLSVGDAAIIGVDATITRYGLYTAFDLSVGQAMRCSMHADDGAGNPGVLVETRDSVLTNETIVGLSTERFDIPFTPGIFQQAGVRMHWRCLGIGFEAAVQGATGTPGGDNDADVYNEPAGTFAGTLSSFGYNEDIMIQLIAD